MPSLNLEQVRARNALELAKKVASGQVQASGKEGGDAMRKIPAMVMASGLLATIAFAIEKKKDKLSGEMVSRSKGHRAIFDAVAEHLATQENAITPGVTDAESLMNYLVAHSSETLKRATDEALAWLAYARRFVVGEGEGGDPAEGEP